MRMATAKWMYPPPTLMEKGEKKGVKAKKICCVQSVVVRSNVDDRVVRKHCPCLPPFSWSQHLEMVKDRPKGERGEEEIRVITNEKEGYTERIRLAY